MRLKLRIHIHYKEPKLQDDYAIFSQLNQLGISSPQTTALKHEVLEMNATIKGTFTNAEEEGVKAIFLQRFQNVEDIQIQVITA